MVTNLANDDVVAEQEFTAEELMTFTYSSTWTKIKKVIDSMIGMKQVELEQAVELERVREIQASIRELRIVRQLPDALLDEIHSEGEGDVDDE